MEVTVFWKDARNMCAIRFIRLEDYLEDKAISGEMIALEPQGVMFAEVMPLQMKLRFKIIPILMTYV